MTQPIKKVVFFNLWKNGDIFSNKEYVRQFAEQFLNYNIEVCYLTGNQQKNAVNLPYTHGFASEHYPLLSPTQHSYFDGETLFINTWVGHHITFETHNIASQKVMWQDISNLVHTSSNSAIQVELYDDNMLYVPNIDTDLLELPSIPEGRKVLICNNLTESGQSLNNELELAINSLAGLYPDVSFYCTQKVSKKFDNIYFMDDVVNREKTKCNLPEIAWFSQHCELIVSNNSGPGAFIMTRRNFLDSSKTILTYLLYEQQSYFYGIKDVKCRTQWFNIFGDEAVLSTVKDYL